MKLESLVGVRHAVALVGAAAVCAIVAGCIRAAPVTAAVPPIICESSYSNFAWGGVVTYTGIADNGQVLHFDSRTAQGLQGFALLDLALPDRPRAAHLAHRYVVSSPTGAVVPPAVLDRIMALAEQVRDGEVTRESRGADMGQSTLECFVASSDGRYFESIVLRSEGDWEMHNTDPAAPELIELLTSLLASEPAPAPAPAPQ